MDVPLTNNVDKCVDAFCDMDVPLTNNVDKNVHGLFKLGIVGGFEIAL